MSKKIVLFIVEGGTEQTALEAVLEEMITKYEKNRIGITVTGGDILTKDNVRPDNIVTRVAGQIKGHMEENHFRKSDYDRVVHLIDTDGLYIPDANIVFRECEKAEYSDEFIYHKNVVRIIKRNEQKRNVLAKLRTKKVIMDIPYSMYYFSCNMDHVLHNERNLPECDKIKYAEQFDDKYGEQVDLFYHFMSKSEFAVQKDWSASWKYIESGTNSLKRLSNLHICLDEIVRKNAD